MADDAIPDRALHLTPAPGGGRQTAHEYVRETLRQSILSGDVPSGTRLVQADLAEQLDVSTTPVREALRDLASEGLIQFDPHRGGVVHEISQQEMEQIYDLRGILEVEAMRRAAERITPDQIAEVRSILQKMAALEDTASWVTLNRDFHVAIYEASDSPRLVSILRGLLDSSVMYVSAGWRQRPDLRKRAGSDHEQILDALEAHDADRATHILEQHMNIPRSVLKLDN